MDKLPGQPVLGEVPGSVYICVENIKLKDWQRFIDFLKQTDSVLRYSVDGVEGALPESIGRTVLSKQHQHMLSIRLADISLSCFFDRPGEIKLLLNPAEIDGEAKVRIVLRLMSTVGRTLHREVTLRIEQSDGSRVLSTYPS